MKILGNIRHAIFWIYETVKLVLPDPLGLIILQEKGWIKCGESSSLANWGRSTVKLAAFSRKRSCLMVNDSLESPFILLSLVGWDP